MLARRNRRSSREGSASPYSLTILVVTLTQSSPHVDVGTISSQKILSEAVETSHVAHSESATRFSVIAYEKTPGWLIFFSLFEER